MRKARWPILPQWCNTLGWNSAFGYFASSDPLIKAKSFTLKAGRAALCSRQVMQLRTDHSAQLFIFAFGPIGGHRKDRKDEQAQIPISV